MINDQIPYIIALNRTEVVGPVKYQQLTQAFGSPQEAWEVNDSEIRRLGWGPETTKLFLKKRHIINRDLKNGLRRIEKLGVAVLTQDHLNYPPLLKEIPDAPYILYVRGNVEVLRNLSLGVVGSRRITSYGREVIDSLVPELVSSGVTIVSGLAFGVDYQSQKVALESGGRVVAVLASGVDRITPYSNELLGIEILKSGKGAIVSEFPLGHDPKKQYFPFRNRIISGLSMGVLVIEATEKSGTMHTVAAALKQGRDVFSVPGSIFSTRSVGTNKLISDGARVVQKANDILDELNVEWKLEKVELENIAPESEEEEAILMLLEDNEVHIDEIIRILEKPVSQISPTLINMEVRGLVKEEGGVYRKSV